MWTVRKKMTAWRTVRLCWSSTAKPGPCATMRTDKFYYEKILLWEAPFGRSRIAMLPRPKLTRRPRNASWNALSRNRHALLIIKKVLFRPTSRKNLWKWPSLKTFRKHVNRTFSSWRKKSAIWKTLRLWVWSTGIKPSLISHRLHISSNRQERNFIRAKKWLISKSSSSAWRKKVVPSVLACYWRAINASTARLTTIAWNL